VRLAVVLDDPRPRAWVGELLRVITSSNAANLVAVLVSRPKAGLPSAVDLFGRLDRRVFASGDDPFLPWPHELRADVTIDLGDPDLMPLLGSASPDIVLHLGDGPPPTAFLDLTDGEVWRFERGDPPYLADVAHGVPVCATTLEARRGDDSRTLGRVVTRVDPASWHRTQAHAYRQSSELAVASLRKLHEGRTTSSTPPPAPPPTRLHMRRLAAIPARAVRQRIRWQRRRGQWALAFRPGASPKGYPTDTVGFTVIEPPPNHSWADPFLVTNDDGERYVFFEDQPHATGKGVIACARIGPEGLLGPPRTILEREYHLSYPFVFHAGDDWLLLPESSANRTVELYRATRFPTDWELHRVLLEGAYVTDATPLEHDGRTWIFASMETSTGYPSDAVSLFWADSIIGTWHAHPLNPIVTDVRTSRPGGRIIARDGRLIRPAQDGSRGYGCGLSFQEITRITTSDYEERPCARISFDWLHGSIGTHHFDGDGVIEVVDIQRLIRRRAR
jgi:hypothetical protein